MSILEIVIALVVLTSLIGLWTYLLSNLSLILPSFLITILTIGFIVCVINFVISRRK